MKTVTRSQSIICSALLAAMLWLTASVSMAAQELTREMEFSIPSQRLADAILQFSEQTRVQIVTLGSNVSGLSSPGVSGTYRVEDALRLMLKGTGLTFNSVGGNTVSLVQMSAASAEEVGEPLKLVQSEQARPTEKIENSGKVSSGVSSEAAANKIEEIVVTAQKREERLQQVPISMSVLSGRELDRATDKGLLDVLNRTPGVALYGSDRPLLSVRGVSSGSVTSSAGANPVAFYLDTVPFGLARTSIVPDVDTYDLERVEVLRGPQGTLYGANAQNGVIKIITKDANLDAFELKVRTAFSDTKEGGGNVRADAAINAPLVPGKAALRGVFSQQNLSGWIDKPQDADANDAELRTVRLKFNAQLTDALSLGLSTWLSRADYGAPPNSDADRRHPSLIDEPISDDYDVHGLTLTYEFPSFALRSVTGYLEYDHSDVRDFAPTVVASANNRLATRLTAETFSQELILSSKADTAWKWTLGAMYRDGEDRLRQNNRGGGLPFDQSQGSESYAIFGEIGRRVLDNVGLAVGLRQFHDDAFVRENINQGPVGGAPIFTKVSFNATTPRVTLTWYPSDDLTFYGSYSQGFRSGFPQNPAVARNNPGFVPLDPDRLHNYETGFKGELLNGHLYVEAAAFYIDWKGTQQSLSVLANGIAIAAQVNSQSASGPGVDFALTLRPIDGLQLSGNVSWNDLTFDADVVSRNTTQTFTLFPKGGRLNGSPELTAGVSLSYDFPLGGGGFEGRFAASANHISERLDRFLLGTNLLSSTGDSTLVARSSFTVQSNNHWSASLFAENLGDEDGAIVNSVLSPQWTARPRPRTIGVQFEINY